VGEKNTTQMLEVDWFALSKQASKQKVYIWILHSLRRTGGCCVAKHGVRVAAGPSLYVSLFFFCALIGEGLSDPQPSPTSISLMSVRSW